MNIDNYRFSSITKLTKYLKIAIIICIVVTAISTLSSIGQAQLLSRGSFSPEEGIANDSRERFIGLVEIFVNLISFIIFGKWVIQANQNVRSLGASELSITPGWAFGFFFVPILSLFKPFQAMKELWQASHNPTDWRNTTIDSILSIWWTFHIFSRILGSILFRISLNADTIESLKLVTYLSIFSAVIDIPLYFISISLTNRIALAQHALRRDEI